MPAAQGSSEAARLQVEALRKKLLDLTLRNRMLNYRVSKRLGITVIGEDSFHLHRLLVEENKRFSFVGRPDPSSRAQSDLDLLGGPEDAVANLELRKAAEDELDAFVYSAGTAPEKADTKLTTDEFEGALQLKLRTIQREASIANDELGINTLFLTLASLEWRDDLEKTYRAPLVFVPVKLEKQANGSMRLVHDGNDIGTNLPLKAKLTEYNLKLPDLDEDKTLLDYLAEVESTVRRRGWVVHRDDVCLGFFNYEKYAMYLDLGGETWPLDRKPWMNADLLAMLSGGYSNIDSPITEHTQLDSVREVSKCREVYDADSSQSLAMTRAAEGLSIVIEGPPGTGKSQTITNIIAEAVANGKTVLFVSAKRAALDVVKRKLQDADLGAICLDLHDKLTNRKEFYAELKQTINRSLSLRSEEEKVARLSEIRDKLNAHCVAVNEPVAEFATSPFTAMTRLAGLPKETPEDREGRIDFEKIRHWTEADIALRLHLVQALQEKLPEVGIPVEHPFWGAQIDYLDPAKRLDLSQDLELAQTKLSEAQIAIDAAAAAFRIEKPATFQDVQVLRACAEQALAAPPHDGLSVKTVTWKQSEGEIRRVIGALRVRNARRAKLGGSVKEEIWASDLAEVDEAFQQYAEKWYRFLFGRYRKANQTLRLLLSTEAPTAPQDLRDLVRDVREEQAAEKLILSQSDSMRSLFGVQWQALASDPGVLERLLEWVLALHSKVGSGELPGGLLEFFSGTHQDPSLLKLVEEAEQCSLEAITAYETAAKLLEFDTSFSRKERWSDLQARLARWNESQGLLPKFISYNEVRKQALAKELESVVERADRWPLAPERLATTYLRSYYSGVVREAMQRRPELKSFDRTLHESAISEFRSLDDFKLVYNRAQVRLAHHRRLPTFDNAVGNLQLLKVQCELQRRHKPIRWIMARAGEAVQRAKPVFMMSPLSAAIHLPPEMPLFDMVIFDEASQVKPEDALSAIARAKQCIVVGDTRQMPPTSFFDHLSDEDEPEEEAADEAAELGIEARKLESILSLMSAVTIGQVRRPDLRWHYRSLHPALIQPSNEMFYENRLVVFPSPSVDLSDRQIGLKLHHHPETIYESGSRNRINRMEAELVADAVLKHVKTRPGESLLVAAMNKPQADLIDDEVQRRERAEPEAFQKFRAQHPHEPLAVKNLENVQGDERDVVFISVTYGRDESGVIRQQFGPLLKDGGERRLNVLITRARLRCEVFSNFLASDLRVDAPNAGLECFKRYLKFAESGRMDFAAPTGGEAESPFEEEVAACLNEGGYQVHMQVGSEGYRIDLALIDPKNPGRYLLGIECDGATYHSARSARDRDKLRQRVLESRRWTLHRIWSHDWWQDRDAEVARLKAAIEEAQSHHVPPEITAMPKAVVDPLVSIQESPLIEGTNHRTRPYVECESKSQLGTWEQLRDHVLTVVETEGPIHEDLLFLRLRDAAGFGRATKNVKANIDAAIESSRSKVRFAVDGFWVNDSQLATARDWSSRPAAEKKTEFVTEVEVAAALRSVIQGSFGIGEADAVRAAFKLMGFQRVTDSALDRGLAVIGQMAGVGSVRRVDGLLRITASG